MAPMTTPREFGSLHRRGQVWIFTAVACFIGLSVRLIYIQTEMGPHLRAYRDDQQTMSIRLEARRGLILDTQGRILAGSETTSSIYVDPALISDVDQVSSQLAPILGLAPKEISESINIRRHKRFVRLAREASSAQADAVRALSHPGVGVMPEAHRTYPHGSLLAHVLGFVNIDGAGLEGLELQYDTLLGGQPGGYETECDNRRRPIRSTAAGVRHPVDGRHLVLTIDLVIQAFMEEAIKNAAEEFRAESAVGIAISPASGDVLAMACYPTFDSNHIAEYPAEVRRNRCLTDPVEPGSCFKPFILAAALAERVARLDEYVDCGDGVWSFDRRVLHDTHANGRITFEEVLIKSSNIGMGHLGTRLGNNRLYGYLRDFGYGKPTGIDLPGENGGIVFPIKRWSAYSKTSIPMGQEIAVTPIQLVSAFAALANGGELLQPRIVRAALDPVSPAPLGEMAKAKSRRVIPEPIALAVAQGVMVRLVNETHHKVQLAQYQALGKTGTAQIPRCNRRGYEPDAYLSSFLGAAPAHDPQIAVLIMVRKPKKSLGYYGGTVAGPAVRNVLAQTLAYWNVPPDDEKQVRLTLGLTNEPDGRKDSPGGV